MDSPALSLLVISVATLLSFVALGASMLSQTRPGPRRRRPHFG